MSATTSDVLAEVCFCFEYAKQFPALPHRNRGSSTLDAELVNKAERRTDNRFKLCFISQVFHEPVVRASGIEGGQDPPTSIVQPVVERDVGVMINCPANNTLYVIESSTYQRAFEAIVDGFAN